MITSSISASSYVPSPYPGLPEGGIDRSIINHPTLKPSGNPFTHGARADPDPLSTYRVSPVAVEGIQPDENGIYVKSQNQARQYFVKMDDHFYEVGDFDKNRTTWRLLDPHTRVPGPSIRLAGAGQWVLDTNPAPTRTQDFPSQSLVGNRFNGSGAGPGATGNTHPPSSPRSSQGAAPPPSQSSAPPISPRSGPADAEQLSSSPSQGLWNKLQTAVHVAKSKLQRAISTITHALENGSLAPNVRLYLKNLFGNEVLTREGLLTLLQKFTGTLRDIDQSEAHGNNNLGIGPLSEERANAEVNLRTGMKRFSPGYVENATVDKLAETVVHEFSHTGAGTVDHWYYDFHGDRSPNFSNDAISFTFDNAVTNADTIAKATTALT